MNLLQVSPIRAFPPSSGGPSRVHGLMRGSPASDNITRHVFNVVDRDRGLGYGDSISISDTYKEISYSSLIHSLTTKLNSLLPVDTDASTACLMSNSMKLSKCSNFVEEIEVADVVQVEYPWQFPYVNSVVDDDTLLVYSSHNVETDYHSHLSDVFINKYVHNFMHRIEKEAVEEADIVVTVTERDAKRFKELGFKMDCHVVIPNAPPRVPEDPLDIQPIEVDGVSQSDTFCIFVGSNTPPNREAGKRLVEIARNVDEHVKIGIIGGVSDHIPVNCVPENVMKFGYVDDLEGFYARADFCLNPVTVGSGSNVKLGEYLAYQTTVISTKFGTRGYPSKEFDYVEVAEIDEFEDAIEHLISDSERAESLAANGRELIESELNWEYLSETLFDELHSQLS